MQGIPHGAMRVLNVIAAVCTAALVALALLGGQAAPASARRAYTVVVDAGHGGEDGGAVGAKSGVAEAGLNLTVAKLLREELTSRGITVLMTREDEDALARGKKADMAARREVMNRENVDAVVSVHMNKFSDSSVHGPMAFYMQGSAEGEKLATGVIHAVCDAIGAPRRFANPGDYFVIRESDPVAVLVECGFLSNAEDERLLQTAAHQRLIAKGVADGVVEYLEGVSVLD